MSEAMLGVGNLPLEGTIEYKGTKLTMVSPAQAGAIIGYAIIEPIEFYIVEDSLLGIENKLLSIFDRFIVENADEIIMSTRGKVQLSPSKHKKSYWLIVAIATKLKDGSIKIFDPLEEERINKSRKELRKYMLVKLMEECAEISKAASKAYRFGLDGENPVTNKTNSEELREEIGDLLAVSDLAKALNCFDVSKPIIANNKIDKIWENVIKSSKSGELNITEQELALIARNKQ